MSRPSIAFFDVDNTLVDGYCGYFTSLLLIQKRILKLRRLPLAIFYNLISPFHKANLKKIYEMAAQDMVGTSLVNILKLGRECFDRWIKARLFQEGIDLVEFHKKKGRPVYLMTSGPYMTVNILGEFLGADGRYSGGPEVDEQGLLTRKIRVPLCYREGKVIIAEQVLKNHGASWKDSYYYGDSMDDLFILEKVGHPHLVNPERRLAKIGEERGWPILKFSRVLGATLK